LVAASKDSYQSISKVKTFTPPPGDETFIFAYPFKNLENACIKARRHGLAASNLVLFLKTRS
jgi:DNA polymerase IV